MTDVNNDPNFQLIEEGLLQKYQQTQQEQGHWSSCK